jgi:hypothetical protein
MVAYVVSGSSLTECDDDHATHHVRTDLYGGCGRFGCFDHVCCKASYRLAKALAPQAVLAPDEVSDFRGMP